MAITAFMKVTGVKQGQITGDAAEKTHARQIQVTEFSYGVSTPRDAVSGLPTGKRQHRAVLVTTPTGSHTPKLFQAIVTNEALTAVEIDVYMPAKTGVEALALSIKLTNAMISQFDLNDTGVAAAEALSDHYALTFQKIELTWAAGAVTASDDWELAAA